MSRPSIIRRPRPLLWLRLVVLGVIAGWTLMSAMDFGGAGWWAAAALFVGGTALSMWQALRAEAVEIGAHGFTVVEGNSRRTTPWADVAWFRSERGAVIYRLADHVVRDFEDEDREFVLAGYGWSARALAERLMAAKNAS